MCGPVYILFSQTGDSVDQGQLFKENVIPEIWSEELAIK